jgi:ABC-2 type transport system permease protein
MRRLERSPLAQLTLTWVREFAREPEALFWTFFFPVLLALALGIAFRRGPAESVVVGVVAGPAAAATAATLDADAAIEARVLERGTAEAELRRGRISVLIEPSPGEYTFRFDPTRAESRLARALASDALQRGAGRVDPVVTRESVVDERGSRYIDFLIPGLLGLNLLSTGLWGVGYSLVRKRKDKLLKRYSASPVPRRRFLLAFLLGRLVFLAAEVPLLLIFAWLAFGVPVRGSFLALAFVAILGAFTFTALGLLIASRSRSTEAVTGLMNLVALPMWILSGVFFSAENFPGAMQPLIKALPLTGLVDALRGIMLEGATLGTLGSELAVVAGWGTVCLLLTLRIFRWQ